MEEMVVGGVEALERQEFARAFQNDFAALKADSRAWEEELDECAVLEGAIDDGIE